MGRLGKALAVAGVAAAVAGGFALFSGPEGDAEFYRQAETIGVAVSWPRQHSAAGLARAVVDGAVGTPDAVDCPSHTPITPAPPPSLDEPEFYRTLARSLDELPDSPTEDEVVNRLLRDDLYHPDPVLEDIPQPDPEDPVIDVQVDGADVALSVHRAAPGAPVCVLASTGDGQVEVWRPAGARYHARAACTAGAAAAGEGR